jgi:hypothetical protein
LQDLPPLLGGVPSLSNSSTQPSHTPVSATILGSNLLGSTFLGSNSQGHPSISSPSQGCEGQTSSQGRSTSPPNPSQWKIPSPTHTMAGTNPPPNIPMPYLASLNILDLTKLTNDPILHDPTWPNMPTKLPSNILKFEGKPEEYPTNHVMTFHLWCYSNNIMDDSICLRLFQRNLTGSSTKWYVDEKSGSHVTSESLAKAFLSLLQLLVRHDTGLEIISEFKQTTANHISDHIHEWRRRRSLCKAETIKEQRVDWFLKSLVSVISKDVASTFPLLEEEAINTTQQFDLIYDQSRYLYIVFPDAPRPIPFSQDKPGMSRAADGLIGSMTHINPYVHPPPTYGVPKYPQPYGGTSYYSPPTHRQSYPNATPPPMGGPSPVPMMRLVSKPSTSSPYTSTYNLRSSGSASNSYTPYGSSPQKNPYFRFPSPLQPVAPPPGQPHAGVNLVQPFPVKQLQNFEQLNTENTSHPPNNAKMKGKN